MVNFDVDVDLKNSVLLCMILILILCSLISLSVSQLDGGAREKQKSISTQGRSGGACGGEVAAPFSRLSQQVE